MLEYFGIQLACRVVRIGEVEVQTEELSIEEINVRTEASPVRVADKEAEAAIIAAIDAAKLEGDTLGGVVEVIVQGAPVGLGSHVQWDRKLDGRIAQAVLSIQAFKGCEFGIGFEAARRRGSNVHDPIAFDEDKGL